VIPISGFYYTIIVKIENRIKLSVSLSPYSDSNKWLQNKKSQILLPLEYSVYSVDPRVIITSGFHCTIIVKVENWIM
jgi:hypothetical protein